MTRKVAGFTMIEMMLAVTMTALLVGTVTAVYAYSVERMGYSLASYSTQREAEYGLDVVDHIAGMSNSCTQLSEGGNLCLKCVLPATCTMGNDGIPVSCQPDVINRRSQERWGRGKRVWFYLSNSTGVPTTTGSVLWMAIRSDENVPGYSDTIQAFTYFPGNSQLRLDLVQAFSTAAGTTANQDQISITTGSTQNGTETASTTTSSYVPTLSRSTYERGWRP